MPNPDGSVYKDRRLDLLEWDIVKESAYFFTYVKNDATDLRQGTLYPTASLILPILGKVAYYAEAVTTPLKFEKSFLDPRYKDYFTFHSVNRWMRDSDDEEDAPVQVGVPSGEDSGDVPKEDEFNKYLGLPRVGAEVDLLVWWTERKKEFPVMAKWVRQFLATPASTAGVERAFSAVCHMHGDLRKCTSESQIQ
ncbi:hypothetical protein CYMTET_56956 [Cymbomonas tetramitiformis]|uniref:HAT C-terminal dimerisation domain-containing protein n=1 Tax=Cymbomonas tetramitiformis TaxID=36881 RepID=A0AAE0BBB4_9CHLO|nr:hypothetical protein CYMTET_56956 [Cymbomonas tetramitiformis]